MDLLDPQTSLPGRVDVGDGDPGDRGRVEHAGVYGGTANQDVPQQEQRGSGKPVEQGRMMPMKIVCACVQIANSRVHC